MKHPHAPASLFAREARALGLDADVLDDLRDTLTVEVLDDDPFGRRPRRWGQAVWTKTASGGYRFKRATTRVGDEPTPTDHRTIGSALAALGAK